MSETKMTVKAMVGQELLRIDDILNGNKYGDGYLVVLHGKVHGMNSTMPLNVNDPETFSEEYLLSLQKAVVKARLVGGQYIHWREFFIRRQQVLTELAETLVNS